MFLSTIDEVYWTDNVVCISNLNVTHPDATCHALVCLNFGINVSKLPLLASSIVQPMDDSATYTDTEC